MPDQTLTMRLMSPAATCRLAACIAPRLAAGDVVLLSGRIGAGKTHFARCLIQTLLPEPEDIPSPTYTLVQTYPGRNADIWHADLYRLSSPDDLIELGLMDAFAQDICLIEWPDCLGPDAPENALRVTLSALDDPEARQVDFTWSDPKWAPVLKGLDDDPA